MGLLDALLCSIAQRERPAVEKGSIWCLSHDYVLRAKAPCVAPAQALRQRKSPAEGGRASFRSAYSTLWNSVHDQCVLSKGGQWRPRMRTAQILAAAIAVVGSIALSLPASAERICREDCV